MVESDFFAILCYPDAVVLFNRSLGKSVEITNNWLPFFGVLDIQSKAVSSELT